MSPRCAEINAQIVAGAQNKAIAERAGLSPSVISRHRRICLQPEVLSEAEQVELWLSRADQMFLQAGINGQVREQCQALAAGLRALEFSFKRREEMQTEEARALPHDVQRWTDAERSKMMEFLDHIVTSTKLPTVEEYAARFGHEGGVNREHFDLLPIRN
jgi:hypothetical protein